MEPAERVRVMGKCVAVEGPTLGGTWKEQNGADLFRGSYAVFNGWRGGAGSLDIRLLIHQVLVVELYISSSRMPKRKTPGVLYFALNWTQCTKPGPPSSALSW